MKEEQKLCIAALISLHVVFAAIIAFCDYMYSHDNQLMQSGYKDVPVNGVPITGIWAGMIAYTAGLICLLLRWPTKNLPADMGDGVSILFGYVAIIAFFVSLFICALLLLSLCDFGGPGHYNGPHYIPRPYE